MKLLLMGSMIFTLNAFSYELGKVTISGDCESKINPVETETLDLHSKKIHVPLQVLVDKRNNKLIEREICSVRIPIIVKKNESLLIKNIRQDGETTLDAKAKAILNLDVFAVGTNPEIKLFVESQKSEKVRMLVENKQILTGCGQEVMLALNSAVRIEGTGLGKVLSQKASVDIISQACK
jgi:hypothetical protein